MGNVYNFGSGDLFIVDSTTTYSTKVAELQDVEVNFNFDIKELHGKNRFPIATAIGKGKVEGKASFAEIRGGLLAKILEATSTVGQKLKATQISAVPETPFQITVTNSAKFNMDLGVEQITSTGVKIPLTRVASAPTENQYSVTAGVYTFNTANTGDNVEIQYLYNETTGGQILTLANNAMGVSAYFQLLLTAEFDSKQINAYFYRCLAPKLALNFKQEDFTMPEMDLSMSATGAGLGWLSIANPG